MLVVGPSYNKYVTDEGPLSVNLLKLLWFMDFSVLVLGTSRLFRVWHLSADSFRRLLTRIWPQAECSEFPWVRRTLPARVAPPPTRATPPLACLTRSSNHRAAWSVTSPKTCQIQTAVVIT